MIKVLIVEDEPPIARMLEKMLDRAEEKVQVLGKARNGKEALKMLAAITPDVIFTDIRMPVMGGLELMEEVRKTQPSMQFVILSGYQEFEYARKALRLNAADYLLKPIGEEMLHQVLKKVQAAILEEKEKDNMEMFGRLHNKYVMENTKINPGNLRIAILCFGNFPIIEDEVMFPGSFLWERENFNEKTEAYLKKKGYQGTFWQIPGITSSEYILIYEEDEKDREDSRVLMKGVYDMAVSAAELPVTMLLSEKSVDISSVGVTHMKMRKELYDRILYGASAFLTQGEQEELQKNPVKDCLLRFYAACQTGDRALAQKREEDFWACCEQYPIKQKKLGQYLGRMVAADCELYKLPLDEQDKMEVSGILSYLVDIADIKQEVNCLFTEIRKDLEINTRHPQIAEVKKYMEEHRRDSLNNKKISEKFGFATAYLGRIFKETYGISMGEYLVQLKIADAKQIMRENPNMLLKEVAVLVGYPDPYYFSKVFKKKTGIWPSEYGAK